MGRVRYDAQIKAYLRSKSEVQTTNTTSYQYTPSPASERKITQLKYKLGLLPEKAKTKDVKSVEKKKKQSTNKEYRVRAKELHNLMLQIDPEYADTCRQKTATVYAERKRRRATDPEYHAYVRDMERRSHSKNRANILFCRQARRFRDRFLVLHHYSDGKCECCGERQWEFLAIDHINGGGNKHRYKDVGSRSSTSLYAWIIKNDYPPGFRVLCHNCNGVLTRYGYCPHELGYQSVDWVGMFDKARRGAVLTYYGGKCECCGEEALEFLEIDHKNGDGAVHRQVIGNASRDMAKWAIENDFPDTFRVLCRNCNAARGFYGYCPHKKS